MADLQGLAEALIRGDRDTVGKLTQAAVDEGVTPKQILDEGLVAGMNVVGRKFKANEFYVPEVLIAARAMHAGMDILKPLLAESDVEPTGVVAIGTVKGDLHDIGKSLVGMMMEGAGFEVIDLGTDVGPEKFGEAVRTHKPQLVGLSALLTTTMQNMKSTLEALEDLGVRNQVKVMVGGAPVTDVFAKEIGADGYAPDASRAVTLAKSLL